MRRFAFTVIATTVLLEATNRDALFADFEIWTRALFSIPSPCQGLLSPLSPHGNGSWIGSKSCCRATAVINKAD